MLPLDTRSPTGKAIDRMMLWSLFMVSTWFSGTLFGTFSAAVAVMLFLYTLGAFCCAVPGASWRVFFIMGVVFGVLFSIPHLIPPNKHALETAPLYMRIGVLLWVPVVTGASAAGAAALRQRWQRCKRP